MANFRRLKWISDEEVVRIAQFGSKDACDELVLRFRGAVILVARQTLDNCRDLADILHTYLPHWFVEAEPIVPPQPTMPPSTELARLGDRD